MIAAWLTAALGWAVAVWTAGAAVHYRTQLRRAHNHTADLERRLEAQRAAAGRELQ